jgi:type I restriction enzyme S subunit
MIKYSKIKDICEITNGYAFKSDRYVTDEGARVIRITNVQKGKVVDNDPKLYPFSDLSNLDTYKIYEGDILMSLTGNVGRVGKFPKELLPAYINQRVCRVKSSSDNLLENYLFHFLNSDIFENDAIRNSAGAAQLNLSTKWVSEYEIPLPPLPKQQKIANILDAADALRQNDKALITKYDELTQALFLDMFGDPVSNPKGWEKVEFGKHITVLTDYHSNGSYETLNENVKLKNTPDYALMVRTTDLEKNDFEKDVISISKDAYNYLEKTKVFGGEMIINKIGSAGKVYRMPYLNRPVSLGMNAFMLRFNNTLNSSFIYFLLKTKYGEREISKRVKGAVTKTIRKDAVREIPILLPPLDLQNQFAERVAVIEEQKVIAQNSLEHSESLFNSLLQKAFKGELV